MDWVQQQIVNLEKLAIDRGLPVSRACQMAGFPASLFSRWKAGKCKPTMVRFHKLWETINAYEGGHNEDTRKNGDATPGNGKAGRGARRAVRS